MTVLPQLVLLVNSLLLGEGNFTLLSLAFIVISLSLIYLIVKYKKSIKNLNILLDEKEEKIKSLRQYAYENELKKVEREHEKEKEILVLQHSIKELELKAKEGLKSQIVAKLEESEKRRERQLKRVNLSI